MRDSQDYQDRLAHAIRPRVISKATSGLAEDMFARAQKNTSRVRLPALDRNTWRIGEVGFLERDEKSPWTLLVKQVLPDNTLLIAGGGETEPFVLKGFTCDGITDGMYVCIGSPVAVSVTTSYRTVLGSKKTVFVVEAIDERFAKQTAEEAKQATEEAARQKQQAEEKSRWRQWTKADGTVIGRARFMGMIAGKVRLKPENGTAISVPLNELGEADRAWIAKRQKR